MTRLRPSQALNTYLTGFQGVNDWLLPVLQQVRERYGQLRVLYPGSFLHVTPSLVFSDVSYVDSLEGICKALGQVELRRYVEAHKDYSEEVAIHCFEEDYRSFMTESDARFDLVLSLNAGFISQACKHLLKPERLLLVNDGHYDASRAFVDAAYELRGVFEGASHDLKASDQELAGYFRTKKGDPLTLEMVEANSTRPPSKARFKPAKQAGVYLFQRTSP